VKKSNLTKGLCVAILLASPLAGAEPKYPAADFEPGVIFQDADLIAKHAARPIQVVPPPAPTVTVAAETKSEKAVDKAEDVLSQNYPIALVVLGLIGFAFWSSKRSASGAAAAQQAPVQSAAAAPSSSAAGETGVAKYLKSVGASATAAVAETGVAKYLKTLPATAAKAVAAETGVAKYLKTLPAAAKAATAETGVAKYLKNLPSAK
jgi:hypothetical protein